MTEGEKPKILIPTSARMSTERMKAASGKELGRKGRSFLSIQDELYGLRDKPDEAKEQELKLERARLINEAKEVGVFVSLKGVMVEMQTEYSFEDAYEKIKDIKVERLENEAKGLQDWDDKFSGMLGHYRDGALRNMQFAAMEAEGKSDDEEKALKREIDLLGWGTPPAGLERLLKSDKKGGSEFEKVAKKLENLTSKGMFSESAAQDFATTLAREQGIMPLEEIMELYRRAEDWATPFEISPGQEPRFWVILTDKERDEWTERSTLVVSAAKKLRITSTEDLTGMAEMSEAAIDLNKESFKVLFGMEGVLPALSIYATITGDQKFLGWNGWKESQLTAKEREDNKKKPDDKKTKPRDKYEKYYEANEGSSLKYVFLNLTKSQIKGLQSDYGKETAAKLVSEGKKLFADGDPIKGCPHSIYEANQETFRELRAGIQFWLKTKGRDLLLTENELENRNEFFANKEKAYKTLELRAREAEQVAWNIAFVSSMLEHFDSREYRPKGSRRHGPSNFWTLFQWVAMHPQERWEQKVVRPQFDKGEPAQAQLKEEWSAYGTWATWNVKNKKWPIIESGPEKEKVVFPRILRDTLVKDLFHPLRHKGAEPRGNGNLDFKTLNDNGNKVLFETSSVTSKQIQETINWNKVNDAPNVPYYFDEMRWANVVYEAFKKGRGAKAGLDDLGEALRNLRIPNEDREKILIAYYGIRPKSKTLKYSGGNIEWMGIKNWLRTNYPDFFTDL